MPLQGRGAGFEVTAAERAGEAAPRGPQHLSICSFNIQFLGNSKDRDDEGLAEAVRGHDIVVIQELVAPPYAATFPDGTPVKPDAESREFFDAMKARGYVYMLSSEDTGTGDKIYNNGSATEWWVVFYRPQVVGLAADLPSGFLADDRSNHPDYERVPHAFAFRTAGGKLDFVLVSVHLQPGRSRAERQRRAHELATIAAWVDAHDNKEKDFIILGDMNLEDQEDLDAATPAGFVSLNAALRPTNTNVNSPKPYDHVMYNASHTTEIQAAGGLVVIDLVEAMRPRWQGPGPYPGEPYNHNEFRKRYSDHHPVVFTMAVPAADDD